MIKRQFRAILGKGEFGGPGEIWTLDLSRVFSSFRLSAERSNQAEPPARAHAIDIVKTQY